MVVTLSDHFLTNVEIGSHIAYFDFFPSMDGGAFPIGLNPIPKPGGWTVDQVSNHGQEG